MNVIMALIMVATWATDTGEIKYVMSAKFKIVGTAKL